MVVPVYVRMTRTFLILTLLLGSAAQAGAISFDLNFDRLQEAFRLIPDSDKGAVDEVIALVKRGDHKEALARLNALNKQFPDNSSLRVLTAFALVNLGNYLGAFEEADRAHDSPNGNPYKCLFYSKVALLAGRTEACKRELQHAKDNKEQPKEIKAIEAELKKRKS